MTTEIIPAKEIKELETKSIDSLKNADAIVITNHEQYDYASEKANEAKKAYDAIEARRKLITAPINASLKSINELFGKFSAPFDSSFSIIKNKMETYKREEMRLANIERSKIASKVESGYYKPETGANKIAAVAVAKSNESSTVATVTKYRVVDIGKVPHEFLEVDMAKVKASFKNGQPVPGIEQYKDISTRF